MSKQYTEYNYTIDGDSTEYIVTLDAGYIPMDDSLSDNTETVLSRSISRKIKAKMRSIELKNPDLYLGATSARVYSTFGKVEIVYNSLNKEQSNKYIEVIEDIIVSNGGNVLSSKVDVNTIIIEYEDNSSIMKPGTVNESENFNLYKKEQEYNDYLNNHIGKVVESFEDLLKYRDKIEYLKDDSIVSKLRETISEHDLSKYSDEEYIPYRKHFYPLNDEETLATEEYENAWLHHYSNNPHHWECWCILNPDTGDFELKDDIDEEEYKYYTIERICDWMSMSKIKIIELKIGILIIRAI